jgi:hypothetical protein
MSKKITAKPKQKKKIVTLSLSAEIRKTSAWKLAEAKKYLAKTKKLIKEFDARVTRLNTDFDIISINTLNSQRNLIGAMVNDKMDKVDRDLGAAFAAFEKRVEERLNEIASKKKTVKKKKVSE